ncbi:hypothetical protein C8A01DRAFT_14839 [Parachaetomium inaequale]|uniref:Protein kinase domain-containing protein n=1 Tax=Parachaetomium inaequale TaxID=2588326 RepID=A0AAN6STF9_9PEZI|nr:hypothetical protein C8A01DRAFT_14839 [Parachaetomium inaequale]
MPCEHPDLGPYKLTGVKYIGHSLVSSVVFSYAYNGVWFSVLAASPDDEAGGEAILSAGYKFDQSIEGKFLIQLSNLQWGEFDAARDAQSEHLENELAKLGGNACLPLMRELAPVPIPEPRTLQEQLYPQTYTLQILTEDGKLTCRQLDSYAGLTERHPPVAEDKLRVMGLGAEPTINVPVVKASQVVLVRRLQSFVWLVKVGEADMVCKTSLDTFWNSIGEELEAYLKIRAAGVEPRVPELTGIIQSHAGVIGILLRHIPHKHHSLGALLAGVKQGTVAQTEAAPLLKQKWATQIKETLTGLHALGILWRDIKTDNVLIDDNGDAVVLDFGGGNTMGWVDRDKYGTMEGEMQGLRKILDALEVETAQD